MINPHIVEMREREKQRQDLYNQWRESRCSGHYYIENSRSCNNPNCPDKKVDANFNPEQQADLLEAYETEALWLKVEKPKVPTWFEMKFDYEQMIAMTWMIKLQMPESIVRHIFSFTIFIDPKLKIPWDWEMDERRTAWQDFKDEHFYWREKSNADFEEWNDGEVDDILDLPYCNVCGELNKDMTYSQNEYKRNRYIRNRSQLCYKCKWRKIKVRNVKNYAIKRHAWVDAHADPDDDVRVMYKLSRESYPDDKVTYITMKQLISDKSDSRIMYYHWLCGGDPFTETWGYSRMETRKVSCNYRSVVHGRYLRDQWAQTEFTDGQPRYLLRRVYYYLNHAHCFETDGECAFSSLVTKKRLAIQFLSRIVAEYL